VLRNISAVLLSLWLVQLASAQPDQQPQVKLNVLNVCSPSPEEQQEIAAALARIPPKTSFNQDFEIDRGRSLPDQGGGLLQAGQNAQMSGDGGTADWVRIRRELTSPAAFSRVQYSFSRDQQNMVETLVFIVREPKDLLQISIEDSVSAVTSPANLLTTDTPATRIKLERFGKSSVVLARCSGSENGPPPDQSAYEPLFRSATAIAARYRALLGVRRTVPEELSRIGGASTKPKTSPAAKKTTPDNKSQ
jgi:hypothetical protein